ncbi:MAG: hypothetical protein K6V73_07705 [Firmicutes bacterium]|nr:hypothetical protein [Bacillota bacterium]
MKWRAKVMLSGLAAALALAAAGPVWAQGPAGGGSSASGSAGAGTSSAASGGSAVTSGGGTGSGGSSAASGASSCPVPGAGNGITAPTCEQLVTGDVNALPQLVPLSTWTTRGYTRQQAWKIAGIKWWMSSWRYALPILESPFGLVFTPQEQTILQDAERAQSPKLLTLLLTEWLDTERPYSPWWPQKVGLAQVEWLWPKNAWEALQDSPTAPSILGQQAKDHSYDDAIFDVRITGTSPGPYGTTVVHVVMWKTWWSNGHGPEMVWEPKDGRPGTMVGTVLWRKVNGVWHYAGNHV